EIRYEEGFAPGVDKHGLETGAGNFRYHQIRIRQEAVDQFSSRSIPADQVNVACFDSCRQWFRFWDGDDRDAVKHRPLRIIIIGEAFQSEALAQLMIRHHKWPGSNRRQAILLKPH